MIHFEWLRIFQYKYTDVNGCWILSDYYRKDKDGYGIISYEKKVLKCHRLSWTLTRGPIPDDLCVLHQCDHPPCINPGHLFLGTNVQNTTDKMSKNRHVTSKGMFHGSSVLTDKDVLEIRAKYATGDYTQEQLSIEYGVSVATISLIVNRKHWVHI